MGVIYSVSAILKTDFSKDNIKKILDRVTENNIVYYKTYVGVDTTDHPLNSSEGSELIMEASLGLDEDFLSGVDSRFEEIGFVIFFHKFKLEDGLIEYLNASIMPSLDIRKGEFINDEYEIVFSDYINILLAICKDFKIIELHTEIM